MLCSRICAPRLTERRGTAPRLLDRRLTSHSVTSGGTVSSASPASGNRSRTASAFRFGLPRGRDHLVAAGEGGAGD